MKLETIIKKIEEFNDWSLQDEDNEWGGEGTFESMMGGYEFEDKDWKKLFKEKTGLEVEMVSSEYGGDGQTWEFVFKLNGKLYRINDGYYSSWGDSDYGNVCEMHEVVPVEKTITVYENKKKGKK